MDNVLKTYIVAGVVLCRMGKFLLVQQKKEIAKGLWNIPAGKVEEGYTIEQTAIKEAKEETGYDVTLIRKIDIFQENEKVPARHAFLGEIIGGNLQFPKDEILDAQWLTYDEIREMKEKLRGEWVLGAIEKVREAGKTT
jgi:ADP-ribose pyrophosphatase YjhB (NUDIX family)